MIYPFTLQPVGIAVGLILIAGHLIALAARDPLVPMLKEFPRSRLAAGVLLGLASIWAFWLIATIDLGEFARLRQFLLIAVPVGAVLSWLYVDEFLAVRSLGILALLAAEPLLSSAFLRPELSRLLLVSLAYLWIVGGFFLVGMPYLLRDLLGWVTHNSKVYKLACLAGVAYGVVLVGCAIFFW